MPRARPGDESGHAGDRTQMIQIVDVEHHFGNPYGLKETEIGELCWQKLPLDFPAYWRMIRRVDKEQTGRKSTTTNHLSTTLEFTCSDGRKFWIKYDREKSRYVVMTQAEDEDKPTILGRFQRGGNTQL